MIKKCTAAAACCFAFMLACAVLASFCTDENLLTDGFHRFSESRMIAPKQHRAAAEAVAGYLSGRDAALGREGLPPFSARETRHMEDVRALVAFGRGMRLCRVMPLVFLAVFALKKDARREMLSGAAIGLLAATAAGVLVSLWAAVDFNGLFGLLHRAAFSNDLWLLDPEKDILIGLMPPEFFVSFAKRLMLYMLCLPAGALVAGGLFWINGKGDKNGV